MFKNNGRVVYGSLSSSDFKALVNATGLTQSEFYTRFVEGLASEITFKRWLSSTNPPPTLLAHLTGVHVDIKEIALEVLPSVRERL